MTRWTVTINPNPLTAVFPNLLSIEKLEKKFIFQGNSTSDNVYRQEKSMTRSHFVAIGNAAL
jgi:hypothetical protein